MSRPSRPTRWTTGLPLVLGLVVVWLLLWGSVQPLTIVTGIGVAVGVVRLFELPPVPHVGRLHPVALVLLVGWFAAQVTVASMQVAWQAVAALSPRHGPSPGVIAVQLRSRDDLLLALTATVTALVPGTLVIDVDRAESILYLHVLRGGTAASLDAARRSVLETERRLARAFGAPEAAA